MHRIMITGKRSFIVDRKDVLKGGTERVYVVGANKRIEVELAPGKFIYEVTDKCAKDLSTREDVFIVEKLKDKIDASKTNKTKEPKI